MANKNTNNPTTIKPVLFMPPVWLMTIALFPVAGVAADLHQAEPGEIVIMRKVTPQPVNRVDQQGPILSKADLRINKLLNPRVERANQSINGIDAVALTDSEVAGVRSTPGGMVQQTLMGTGNAGSYHGAGGLNAGNSLSRSTSDSGQLMQMLGTGGGGAGDVMQGLGSALGSALGAMNGAMK